MVDPEEYVLISQSYSYRFLPSPVPRSPVGQLFRVLHLSISIALTSWPFWVCDLAPAKEIPGKPPLALLGFGSESTFCCRVLFPHTSCSVFSVCQTLSLGLFLSCSLHCGQAAQEFCSEIHIGPVRGSTQGPFGLFDC